MDDEFIRYVTFPLSVQTSIDSKTVHNAVRGYVFDRTENRVGGGWLRFTDADLIEAGGRVNAVFEGFLSPVFLEGLDRGSEINIRAGEYFAADGILLDAVESVDDDPAEEME